SMGVPVVVYDPRVPERAGAVISDPIATEDLFPTILGFAGLKPQNPLPGANLTPLIHGEVDGLERDGVLLEFVAELRKGLIFYDEVWRGFRTARYKYVVKGDNQVGGKPWQFFDLENDPCEQKNLIDDPDHQEEVARHHRLLSERLVETEDHFVLLPAYGCDGVNTWQ
ncbi:MAG: hypothetical protein O2954_11710, partial [bacterium]|nr:hypothetical protein [bacterium]